SAALSEAGTLRQEALKRTDSPAQWEATLHRALSALARARALLGQVAGLEELRRQVNEMDEALQADERDRRLAASYEEVLKLITEPDHARRAPKLAEALSRLKDALQEYGLKVGNGEPAAAVALIEGRPAVVRPTVVAALDLYLGNAKAAARKDRRWLRAVLHGVDPDPWREQVRRALWVGGERASLLLLELARQARVDQQKPAFLVSLAQHLPRGPDHILIDLLRRAHRQYPTDF